jgi:hypothetical protein
VEPEDARDVNEEPRKAGKMPGTKRTRNDIDTEQPTILPAFPRLFPAFLGSSFNPFPDLVFGI